VLRLAFWVGQDRDVAEYVYTCQTCQLTKVEHCRSCCLLHPLRRGCMIGVAWIAWLPTTEGWFNMMQDHVSLLSGKVHAVPTRATGWRSLATCASALVMGFLMSWWWITTPSSRERCSWP
jgi:hypothetical protein